MTHQDYIYNSRNFKGFIASITCKYTCFFVSINTLRLILFLLIPPPHGFKLAQQNIIV